VLNKHFVTKQIWYSSPVSSLKYFNYIDGKFLERNNQNLTLEKALFDDLTKI
jgi:frataxin-like iron-binding protein CyaY